MDAHSDPVSIWTALPTRSLEVEWLDDMTVNRDSLQQNLRQLELLNRFLGGHHSLIRGFKRALRFMPNRRLRLVDVGCGGGDGLRLLDQWCAVHRVPVELIGLDLNPAVLETARSWSKSHPGIRYVEGDAFGGTLAALTPDITTATLFCHHFPSTSLTAHLSTLLDASQSLVISDLHRHPISHAAFRSLAKLARLSPMTRHDGAVSIRRGFNRQELEDLVAPLQTRHTSIHWAFAFRYEVLLVR
jgi:2-polyprenyl-3-methyl-5-hydroxy-6-metoxy-1,4-benzoquinol methylase